MIFDVYMLRKMLARGICMTFFNINEISVNHSTDQTSNTLALVRFLALLRFPLIRFCKTLTSSVWKTHLELIWNKDNM